MNTKRMKGILIEVSAFVCLQLFVAWFGVLILLTIYWAAHVIDPAIFRWSARTIVHNYWKWFLLLPVLSTLSFRWDSWNAARKREAVLTDQN